MSNKYFDSANNPNRALPYEVARAEQINNTDDLIEAGLNLVEADVNRAIKLPTDVTTDQVLTSTTAQRQNSLLAFDASGNATLTGTDVAARTGKVMGWDNSGNINLYSYANDITAPVNAAAASASAAADSATSAATSATNSANSATASATSATNSAASATLASDWAQKTTGEVVTGQGYSAKYWANEAAKTVSKGVIDDAATSTLTTWSSSKIDSEKQDTLVSGTNLKTINGTSMLGYGNFTIEGVAVYEYADRALLRGLTPTDKQQAIVKSIGLFVFKVGATDLDDDEICFATANGRWLLETVHWDFVNAQLPDIPQVVTVKANNPILTVGAVASVTFNVPAPSCKMGDIVIASPPSQLPAHITYHAFVAETGLIRMVVSNPSAAASGTFPTGDWSFAIFEQF